MGSKKNLAERGSVSRLSTEGPEGSISHLNVSIWVYYESKAVPDNLVTFCGLFCGPKEFESQ